MPRAIASRIIVSTAASVTLWSTSAIFRGVAIRENAGSPALARFNLKDGINGPVIFSANLALSTSVFAFMQDGGVRLNTGLYLEMLAGTIEGVWYLE